MRQRKKEVRSMKIKKVGVYLQSGTIPTLPLGCCGANYVCGGKSKVTIY